MARISWKDLASWALSLVSSKAAEEVKLQSDLNEHLTKLRTALPTAYLLIDRAEWWRFDSVGVADLLKQLKDVILQAGDLLDESDYDELRRKAEGTSNNQARKFLAPASSFVIQLVERRAKIAVEVHERLTNISDELEKSIKMLDLNKSQHDIFRRKQTGSIITAPKIFGRMEEKEKLISLLLKSYPRPEMEDGSTSSNKRIKRDNLSVLPIVGIGGVGKTTLARLVYNDSRVQGHFHLKIWICVSDQFDLMRLTKEIIGHANMGNKSEYDDLDPYKVKMKRRLAMRHTESQYGFNNLSSLQERLKDRISTRRFLIVLDDVWTDNRGDWEDLFAPLRYGLEGSKILVTTRSPKVSHAMGNSDPFLLNGLPENTYWSFFKACVFGDDENQIVAKDVRLLEIGWSIAGKLGGSPLAAKSIASLLKTNLNVNQWRSILNSELWELGEEANGILPALRLSYQYLPPHLKRCFSFCAMFPKDYLFQKNRLVDLWVSAGLIMPKGNESLERIGMSYFEELVMRFFFQMEPKFNVDYLIQDLMHDLAQLVSQDECFCLNNVNFKGRIPAPVRYLSIDFELAKPNELLNYRKLHSLYFLRQTNIDWGVSLRFLFDNLTCLRILKLTCFGVKEIPENIRGLKHLRYLDVSRMNINTLPQSLCLLYKLEILDIRECPLQHLPQGFSNLINLRKIYSLKAISTMVPEIGGLTALQNLQDFEVLNKQGHDIGQLRAMSRLRGILNIKNLENVQTRDDALQANLCNKKYLDAITLEWCPDRDTGFSHDEEVLEGLEPHSNVKHLVIRGYGGYKSPSWLNNRVLHSIVLLRYENCSSLMEITNFPSFLTKFDIIGCPNIASLQILSYLPYIRTIYISNCEKLISLPIENFGSFNSLESLEVVNCPNLKCSTKLSLPPSIKRFVLKSCGDLDRSLSKCLYKNLNLLATLELYNCPHVLTISDQVFSSLKALHILAFSNCKELRALGEFQKLSSLKYLSITKCPKLVLPKYLRHSHKLRGINGIHLDCLTIDNTSLLDLPGLRNSFSSLRELTIENSLESVMFGGEGRNFSENLRSVRELWFKNCFNLLTVPVQIKSMTCLEKLSLTGCRKVHSVQQNDLPATITSLNIRDF